MTSMSISKFQKDGKYLMLALDHRGSFKKYVKPEAPETATDQEVIKIKSMIISSLENQFSGVLIDPDWGLPDYDKQKPFLLCLEKTGYTDLQGERLTELQYPASQLRDWGASGAKLLIYFNPESTSCEKQIETAKKALADAHQNDLPLFLEIVTYGNEELGKSRSEWVIKSLEKIIQANVIPDVWKLEYTGDKESCQKITEMVGKTPWILLTRGDSFEVFREELVEAVGAGAVGFLAGRALWQEISKCTDEKTRLEFLNGVVSDRFAEISEIVLNGK